jgi:hypothetical protein
MLFVILSRSALRDGAEEMQKVLLIIQSFRGPNSNGDTLSRIGDEFRNTDLR